MATTDKTKRAFMKSALGVGGLAAATKMIGGGGWVKEAHAQLLASGIDANSVLARVKKEGVLRVGYAQTDVWFYKDAKTNQLAGLYYDVAESLKQELEVKFEYVEVSWADATIGLRKGDFDVFVSSLFYTVPRALVVCYVAPMWHKGELAVTHKDNAGRFKSSADFNRADVTFSVDVGGREEYIVKTLFPKAKVITSSGQEILAAEPVRAKKAHLWVIGEIEALLFAKKNSWAHVVDEAHPFGKDANTWAIRYGDPAWKAFLDMWADHIIASGFIEQHYAYYKAQLKA
jgi:polar amino acid transport system substrate-binding protein